MNRPKRRGKVPHPQLLTAETPRRGAKLPSPIRQLPILYVKERLGHHSPALRDEGGLVLHSLGDGGYQNRQKPHSSSLPQSNKLVTNDTSTRIAPIDTNFIEPGPLRYENSPARRTRPLVLGNRSENNKKVPSGTAEPYVSFVPDGTLNGLGGDLPSTKVLGYFQEKAVAEKYQD